jgi:hypothetical protein
VQDKLIQPLAKDKISDPAMRKKTDSLDQSNTHC